MIETSEFADARIAMFDPAAPAWSGNLMGESFGALVDNCRRPLGPKQCLRVRRIVALYLDGLTDVLCDLGFSLSDVITYRVAATEVLIDAIEGSEKRSGRH